MLGLGIGISTLAVRNRSIMPQARWDFGLETLPATASFSRASVATYFDASGILQTAAVDQPRFEYDPSTGGALGLLIEQSSTNLHGAHTHPNDLSSVYKVGDAASILSTVDDAADLAMAGLAASGSTVYKLDNTAGVGAARIGINPTFDSTGPDICMSAYVRGSGTLNLRTGFAGHPSQGALTAGYLRYQEQTSEKSSGAFNANDGMWIEASPGTVLYTSFIQAEVGDGPSSYIPTSGAPATRAADVLSTVGLNGIFDVRITYGNNSVETFLSQTIADGWQPNLSGTHVKDIDFYSEGLLA